VKLKNDQLGAAGFDFARKVTAHYSKSFFFSASILPRKRRWATYAVYAFCRYADNLIDKPRDRSQKELIEEIDAVAAELRTAYRTGESEHPIIGSFIRVAQEYEIPLEYPLDLLRGVKMDLQQPRYRTFNDLYLFCYRVAGVVGLMMTHVLGYRDKQAFVYAERLGVAMQLTNILRDIKEDKDMGRLYIPEDEMRRFNVTEEDIRGERVTPELRQLMEFQVCRADRYYEEAVDGIQLLDRKSRYAISSASRIYRGILNKIERRDFNPFEGRVYVSDLSKLCILAAEIVKTRLGIAPPNLDRSGYAAPQQVLERRI